MHSHRPRFSHPVVTKAVSTLAFHNPQPCQDLIFAQRNPCGKNYDPRKSGKSVEGRRFFLCKSKLHIHNRPPLWKTPVEKPVENVENSELSTGISLLSKIRPSCGKECIHHCIIPPPHPHTACYVTAGRKILPDKIGRKSWEPVKKCCQKPLTKSTSQKIFVKNRQKTFWYHLPKAGNTFPEDMDCFWIQTNRFAAHQYG